ncbi:hypothetical protein C8R44DRAFT_745644 [Mycena epipterygia]|nr:hypothetical protein C8R44DRAFT_745644 [Mycena epipterygia]
MGYPVLLCMALFTTLVLATIVTIVFSITFRGLTTENEVYTSVGEQDDLRQMLVNWQPAGCGKYFAHTEQSYASLNYGTGTNCGRPSVNLNRLSNHITYSDQQFVYPFDDYESRNTFIAFTPSADGSISNATFLPILNVAAVDASETFVPSHNYLSPVPNASVMFNGIQIDKAYVFMLTVRRSLLAKVFTIAIFLLNWGLVVSVMYITVVAYVSKDRNLGDWALAAPLTIILTIPGLRGLFVGDPPFGILLDAIGIFLQMIVVCICASALVLKIRVAKKSVKSDIFYVPIPVPSVRRVNLLAWEIVGLQPQAFNIPTDSNLTMLTLARDVTVTKTLLQDNVDLTVMSGITTFGGLWIFINGTFASSSAQM